MRKPLYLFVVILLLSFSCSDDEQTCGVDDPLTDLAWLKAKIDEAEDNGWKNVTIYQGRYRFQTVFVYDICCTTCLTRIPVYNCEGEELFTLYTEEKTLSDVKVLWQSENYVCQ